MKTFLLTTVQIVLLAITYEFACLPVWQYLITVGLIVLVCVIGMEHINGGN